MLVLASRSPQRKAILEQLGIAFRVEPSDVDEVVAGPPDFLVVENAGRKSRAVEAGGSETVLGADTAVAIGGRPLGKPGSESEAEEFLRLLSGKEHEVHGGVVVRLPGGAERTGHAVTRVQFRDLDDGTIAGYLDTEEWRGRAGGYAIQGRGARLVDWIEGDYFNVVGLPVPTLVQLAPELFAQPAPPS